MTKLNQVIAVEKSIKNRAKASMSEIYKAAQKPALFDGMVKTWEKLDEDGEARPAERRRVQVRSEDVLDAVATCLSELFNVTSQKDSANCAARADVTVAGVVVLKQVPATHLIFLEKQLVDVRTLVAAIPVVSADEEWKRDEALGLYRTDSQLTRSTAKVETPIILAQATVEHPAQTQLITKDITVGHWRTVKQSGALVMQRKTDILKKIEALTRAIKYAREEANSVDAPPQTTGEIVFDYIFAK